MRPVLTGFLGLGANVGDPRAQLQAAVDALAAEGVRVLGSSSVYETDPVGLVLDQPDFLNAAVRIETALEPRGLLHAVKRVEAAMGRRPEVRHGPREIDIDILLLDGVSVAEDGLTVPHAALLERRFALVPLLELDIALATPDGRRLADALAVLEVDEDVRRLGVALRVG